MSGIDSRTTKVALICTIPITAHSFYMPLARALKKNGYDVSFCFGDGPEANIIRSEGFQVKTLSIRRKPTALGNILALFQLTVFLRRNEVVMIETSTPIASAVGRLAAVLAGVPIRVNTIRGMFPRKTHKWQSLLFDCTEMALHRISSFTVTINESDKQELLRKGFAEPHKILNMGCGSVGVDLERFNPYRYERDMIKKMKTTFDMRENDFVVTFIGRLTEDKGISEYIEVIEALSGKNDAIKGLVVGDVLEDEHEAVSRTTLEAMLVEKGIRNKVTLTGHRDDVPDLMAITDVVVLPSKREGFGMVLAEAAAMEKPVVAYRCRGVEEAVIEGKTGFIIEPGDINGFAAAIQYLFSNKNRAREIGLAARTEAETRFDQTKVVERYLKVFNHVIHAKLP